MDYIAQPKDYWIAPNAIHISLNALGDANRIQCSVASGAVIMCYIYGTTNDGLGYDNGHQYRTWPIVIAPTYFNTNTQKYVYVAIPKNQTVGTTAIVVFPSEQLDIYGKNASDEQIGSTDYFFIWLQGIISEVQEANNTTERQWTQNTNYGLLDTDQARDAKTDDTAWYSYSHITEVVTFLKEIVMNVGSSFRNLFLGPNGGKELASVATDDTTPEDSTTAVVTPVYASGKFLSKTKNDAANGLIKFIAGLHSEAAATFGEWLKDVAGAGIYQDDQGNWHIESDYLHARKKLVAKELQIEEVTHVGGQQLLSAAEMVCDYVVEHDTFYRCYFLKEGENGRKIYNNWASGDQARMQSFNVEEWETGKMNNRYYWRLVVGTSNDTVEDIADYNQDFSIDFNRGLYLPDNVEVANYHFIDLSKSDCDTGSDIPMEGDKIIQLGHRTDATRQNAIMLAGAGTASPYIDEYVGINSYSLEGKVQTRIKPNENLFTGKMQMNPDSTYDGQSLANIFSSYNINLAEIISQMQAYGSQIDEISNGLNDVQDGLIDIQESIDGLENLSTGNENLLRNTGFTGDYETEDMDEDIGVSDDTQVYSDPLKYWTSENATVIVDINSASGFSLSMNNGSLSQDPTKPLVPGDWYNVSFRASGTYLELNVAGFTERITLSNTLKRYSYKFKCSSQAINIFSITSATARVMEIQLSAGSIPNVDWIPSPLDNSKAIAYYQDLVYLANAMANASTSILGGLILTNMIRVGNYRDRQMIQETGGMSGTYNSGNSPFLWGGGTMEQAFYTIGKYAQDPSYQATPQEISQMAKFVVTHGGRAILNDIVLRGYIYALGGYFKGEVHADSGIFKNILSPNGKFKIDDSGYFECEDAKIKGYLYTPLLVINENNWMQYLGQADPDTSARTVNIGLSGLNIQFDYLGWGSTTSTLNLPLDDQSLLGAQVHILNNSSGSINIHYAYVEIGGAYVLYSGKLAVFYCYYNGVHYQWAVAN